MSPSVEPFNDAKYKALMDGLECSEIFLSALESTKRMDSEYYQKQNIRFETRINGLSNSPLGEIAKFLIGPFGSAYDTSNYVTKSDFRYVRGQDVKPFILKDNEPKYISEEDYHRLEKYALHENDIMISVVGTLGNACIVRKRNIPAIFSCKSTVVRPYGVSSQFLVTFLNCNIGRQLLLRKERGAIQKGLNLEDLKTLLIPVFSSDFQKVIDFVVNKADEVLNNSNIQYTNAQIVFNNIFNFNWSSRPCSSISVKSFSESFGDSGRLDAEYYQPKYDQLFGMLSHFPTKKLGGPSGIANIQKSIEPGSDVYCDDGIPFVRVSDVTKFGITDPEIHLPENIVPDPEKLYPKKNTILFSKDGSVGIAYKMENDAAVITSGALLHLTVKNPDEVLPDYLTLVLNSPIVQLQAERDSNGAIIQHWKPSEIENAIIPILDIEIQKEIAQKVQESFSLRHKSEQLLEYAKQAVEMAIEQGEENAMEWLKEKGVEA